MTTRRQEKLNWIGLCVLAVLVATSVNAQAEEHAKLYVGWQGGSRENLMREKVFPAFEAAHNVKIEYVAGVSTELLARLTAQRSNQEMDVVLMDDGPMYQAVSFGLCEKLQPNPIYGKMTKSSVMNGVEAFTAGIGVVALGLVYNVDAFKKNGWPAPTSWTDLERSELKGREAVMSISNTFGLGALVAFARLAGGAEDRIDAGFKRIKEKVKPNVLAWVPTSGQLSSMFQNGDVDIAAWSNDRANALKEAGFPAKFVSPKEGAIATLVATCAVTKPTPNPLAQEFVRYLLSPEVQLVLAEGAQLSPANSETKLPPDLAERLAKEDGDNLVKIDWNVVNASRADWTRRWTREIER